MKKKKVEGEMMEEAIEKASQLIALLQRESKDAKKKNQVLEIDLQKMKKDNHDLERLNDNLIKKTEKYEQNIGELMKELEESRQAVHLIEQSLKKKTSTNKQLHEKISVLTAKIKEKSRELSEQKTKNLSLQNENEYLIKKISESGQKQNEVRQQISSSYNNREKELKEAIRLKEAFSRRCEELKADNASLIQAAADYKQRALNKQVLNEHRHPIKFIVEEKPILTKVEDSQDKFLVKLIEKLGLQPEKTSEQQFNQINSFIGYRLTHLNKLWEGISSKLQFKQWSKLQNLKDLQSSVQRILIYLNQVLSKSG